MGWTQILPYIAMVWIGGAGLAFYGFPRKELSAGNGVAIVALLLFSFGVCAVYARMAPWR